MKVKLNGKELEGNSFDNTNPAQALEDSQSDGYRPLFMPEVTDLRIDADKNSELFNWHITPSIRATGETNQGNKIVVYAHVDNYFSNPNNIRTARKNLVNGAGRIPQEEFQKLVDKDELKDDRGNRLVWVISYEKLRKSSAGIISVDSAMNHPQTIPFLGGEERARKYLEKHEEVFGPNIGIWHTDDLREEALGRLLRVGDDYDGGGLVGNDDLYDVARFFGVRDVSAEGAEEKNPVLVANTKATPKISAPRLEDILAFSTRFVPEVARREYEAGLRNLFK